MGVKPKKLEKKYIQHKWWGISFKKFFQRNNIE